MRAANEVTKTKLNETQTHLDSMLAKCQYLDEQMVAKDNFYANRVKELDELHQQELHRGASS